MTDAGRAMDAALIAKLREWKGPLVEIDGKFCGLSDTAADAITALRSERDRLQSIVACHRGSYAKEQAIAADAEQRAEKAEREAEANRRDAERYRWLLSAARSA